MGRNRNPVWCNGAARSARTYPCGDKGATGQFGLPDQIKTPQPPRPPPDEMASFGDIHKDPALAARGREAQMNARPRASIKGAFVGKGGGRGRNQTASRRISFCAQRGAGVFLNISAKFRRSSESRT